MMQVRSPERTVIKRVGQSDNFQSDILPMFDVCPAAMIGRKPLYLLVVPPSGLEPELRKAKADLKSRHPRHTGPYRA